MSLQVNQNYNRTTGFRFTSQLFFPVSKNPAEKPHQKIGMKKTPRKETPKEKNPHLTFKEI